MEHKVTETYAQKTFQTMYSKKLTSNNTVTNKCNCTPIDLLVPSVPGVPKLEVLHRSTSSLSLQLTAPSFLGKKPLCWIALQRGGTLAGNRTEDNPQQDSRYTHTVSF